LLNFEGIYSPIYLTRVIAIFQELLLNEESSLNIVLTYDPRWKYTPKNHTPFWASLDTIDYVVEMLEDAGYNISPIKADNRLRPF